MATITKKELVTLIKQVIEEGLEVDNFEAFGEEFDEAKARFEDVLTRFTGICVNTSDNTIDISTVDMDIKDETTKALNIASEALIDLLGLLD